jgi:hypothetical protein
METLGVIVAVLGIFVTWAIYQYQKRDKIDEEARIAQAKINEEARVRSQVAEIFVRDIGPTIKPPPVYVSEKDVVSVALRVLNENVNPQVRYSTHTLLIENRGVAPAFNIVLDVSWQKSSVAPDREHAAPEPKEFQTIGPGETRKSRVKINDSFSRRGDQFEVDVHWNEEGRKVQQRLFSLLMGGGE